MVATPQITAILVMPSNVFHSKRPDNSMSQFFWEESSKKKNKKANGEEEASREVFRFLRGRTAERERGGRDYRKSVYNLPSGNHLNTPETEGMRCLDSLTEVAWWRSGEAQRVCELCRLPALGKMNTAK